MVNKTDHSPLSHRLLIVELEGLESTYVCSFQPEFCGTISGLVLKSEEKVEWLDTPITNLLQTEQLCFYLFHEGRF